MHRLPSVMYMYTGKERSVKNLYIKTIVKKGMKHFGLSKLSSLQTLSIQIILEKRDLVFQAQSGTGKTTAYIIGACGSLKKDVSTLIDDLIRIQTLIIVPTRELVDQVNFGITSIGFYQNIKTSVLYGGTWIGIYSIKRTRYS